jgi:shikimate kinase
MSSSLKPFHRIFLTGMPGAGKSYWAQQIAQGYSLNYIDLDDYIVMREGKTIQELFAEDGEDAFRDKENRYLVELITDTGNDTVIACGGGTPCFSDNMRLMKINGVVIYIEAEVDFLYNNIANEIGTRPLLADAASAKEQLSELYLKRKRFYEQAHYILHVKDISLATFGEIIGNV